MDANPKARLPWLATAYVRGPSLRQAVADHGPLPLPTVFRLLAGVSEGLAAVHACGIVHRDLTPANVLLAEDGPRVIDFGIAHAAAATSLTRAGLIVGTPAFMAPEQVRGRGATPAVDVFALGNQDALLYRIRNEPPDLDDCPHELRELASRCLTKEPRERPGLTEVVRYSREQTQGQTMQLAGSWLPASIATSLDTFDTTAYLPPSAGGPAETKDLTKVQVAKTKVDGKAGTTTKDPTKLSLSDFDWWFVVGFVAIMALFIIGPNKVIDTVSEWFDSGPATPPAGSPLPWSAGEGDCVYLESSLALAPQLDSQSSARQVSCTDESANFTVVHRIDESDEPDLMPSCFGFPDFRGGTDKQIIKYSSTKVIEVVLCLAPN